MKHVEVIQTRTLIYFVLAPVVMLMPVRVQGGQLSAEDVQAAVQTWVRYVTADANPSAVIERMEPYRVDGETLAYIAHIRGGGFCLCGADDVTLPVHLYNPKDAFDPTIPPLQYYLSQIAEVTRDLRQNAAKRDKRFFEVEPILAKRAVLWKDLMAGRVPEPERSAEAKGAEPQEIALPLTSRWNQDSPYNDDCPVLTPGSDEHCVVGCVPTALAQIMYYWKWPLVGEGSEDWRDEYSYSDNWLDEPLATDPGIPVIDLWSDRLRWTSASGGKLEMRGYWDQIVKERALKIGGTTEFTNAVHALYSRLTTASTWFHVNFSAETYNWGIMQDVHADPPDAGDAEVAKLCFHLGMGCNVAWRLFDTAGDLPAARSCLINYYRYDADVLYEATNSTTDAKFIEECQWLRPIQMSGGGHSVVVHGYKTDTDPVQFLINYGNGDSSAWKTREDTKYDGEHNTRIAPRGVVRFVGGSAPGDGSPSAPHENIEEALADAPDGSTLVFKAGSDNTFAAASLLIDRPLILKGWQSVIRKE